MSSPPEPGTPPARSSELATMRLQAVIDEARERGRRVAASGSVASYIPELAKADPAHCGLAVHTVAGEALQAGDAGKAFTMQSISKVFALACVQAAGIDPYRDLASEPSGDAFHSIVKLEEERGRPRNPLINAGAILVSSLLPGASAMDKLEALLAFLARCAGGARFACDEAVYASECRTGYRNRALAHYMRHFGVLAAPDTAVDAYFRQCAVAVTAAGLARLALFLANDGADPLTGERILAPDTNRRILALMALCGLYDEVGAFATRVGLPAKSGVSGGILAVVPGRMSICAFGPALGERGNSVAAMAALAHLAEALELSVFAPR